jgi:hypothetical protein
MRRLTATQDRSESVLGEIQETKLTDGAAERTRTSKGFPAGT